MNTDAIKKYLFLSVIFVLTTIKYFEVYYITYNVWMFFLFGFFYKIWFAL